MLERWSSIRASVVMGGAWACWDLPLYILVNGDEASAPLAVFLVSVVALSVIYTWFWLGTSGSLLAVLLHTATNAAGVLLLRTPGPTSALSCSPQP